ncbi:hypothetical protein AWC17_28635 [Mycobacterium nebraskense]|uniref:Uncharacterized protein n=2 Tax=Mycobacterium TaxID=1763 RepID=A0A1X1ZV32_9MYCO|nr:O-methyltransferase [Mycobacterium intracellulare subsp. chimaera]ASL18229.1 O-methyltransferase [Mycobacterium intracellulare subsp. chimaera]MCV7120527.1 hypothetical protein [Mycobacterium nebraskense]MCV7328251.1 hypothetical protein [Mycobacterium intracellulare subsp. chimaera]ORW27894.1 hypothetical protein AWC17_28635 [Mycobacterium nebraskense]
MARSDSDSRDLASSVRAAATIVAAPRVLASIEPEPLINDPFADPLVRAAGVDFRPSARRRTRSPRRLEFGEGFDDGG